MSAEATRRKVGIKVELFEADSGDQLASLVIDELSEDAARGAFDAALRAIFTPAYVIVEDEGRGRWRR